MVLSARRAMERVGGPGAASPAADREAERLTAAISRGDAEAFGAFYHAWFDRAYSLARALTRRDESYCLDVVQDAMLRAARSLPPLGSERALAAWMARVVHTTALDQLRREARRVRREERAAAGREARETGEADPGRRLEIEERIQWLAARLREAPEEERVLLRERFGRGKTLAQTGEAVGLTGSAAHGRIRRAVLRLRALAREVFGD
jgi:RNA polymerase sigma factor (sigma-70 family)